MLRTTLDSLGVAGRHLAVRIRREDGQATAEYALVIVAAAAVALALIIWATNTDLLPRFFNAVVRKITGVAEGAGI